MKLLQNILVPVDFSESSNRAVESAIMLAKVFNSLISILHVTPDNNISRELEAFLEKSINEKFKELRARIEKENITVGDTTLERGAPFEKIIQKARTSNPNVIVVGSGNKKEGDVFRLGTTVEKLMRKNQVPLWVVKNEVIRPIDKMLCPVDFSEASSRALTNAITLTKHFDAELTIFNVFTPFMISSPRFKADQEAENQRLRRMQEKQYHDFLGQFDLGSVKHKILFVVGDPHVQILRIIREKGTDLLLMGTTGKTGLSRILMGSVTEKVTRELPCSFITTKARDLTEDFFADNLREIESIISFAKSMLEQKDFEKAIELYTLGIKQYPDNIPILAGLVESYKAVGNTDRANYYRKYAREIIKRMWGEEYLQVINLE
ncbi:MAG TPA: hypothetical protein ENO20_05535 [Bacteroides sp.]|nr:hypothetical protein [Bacteroides sp.]